MEPMISARKHAGVEQVFAAINRLMLTRHFHQIWTRGFEQLAAVQDRRPIVFYANHSNWWDGLIAFYLSYNLLKTDAYVMMLLRQLKKYSFFRWIGAFSVDPASPVSAYRSLEYAATLLDSAAERRRALWIFPQGEMLPNDTRPLTFLRGLAWLAERLPQARLVAVTFRYEFLDEQLPEVFLSFEGPIDIEPKMVADRRQFTTQLQTGLTAQLDRLKDDVVHRRLSNFRPILKGGRSLNIMYERVLKFFKLEKQ